MIGMNVAQQYYNQSVRQRLLLWMGQNSMVLRRNARHIVFQESFYSKIPQRTTGGNKSDNNRRIFLQPLCNINIINYSCSMSLLYTCRYHFAASTPALALVHRQMRYRENQVRKQMEAQYGPNYLRRRPVVQKFPENMVKIEFMHSVDDIQIYHNRFNHISEKRKRTVIDDETIDREDNPGVFRSEWNQGCILELAHDYYGKSCADQLEYYNHDTNDWKLFPDDITNHEELVQMYKGKGNRTMPLRLPSEFHDGHVSDDDIDMVTIAKGEKSERAEDEAVRIIIQGLIGTLRREKYVRVSNTSIGTRLRQIATDTEIDDDDEKISVTIINSSDDTASHNNDINDSNDEEDISNEDMIIIPTKQWIVERAEKDRLLASLLMSRPGALKHIVQCIHWDRLWK